MAVMPGVQYLGRAGNAAFVTPNPVGCIIHRVENPDFEHTRKQFLTVPHYPHFLVGKQGQIVQVADTSRQTVHVGNANGYYIGIETSSVSSRYEHKQDPAVIRDSFTLPQAASVRRVVDWVSSAHRIPKIGPPSMREMQSVRGRWHGFCSHADVSLVISSSGDHEEGIEDQEFLSLGIWPADSRQGQSLMTELLPTLDRQATERGSADREKINALDQFLKDISRPRP